MLIDDFFRSRVFIVLTCSSVLFITAFNFGIEQLLKSPTEDQELLASGSSSATNWIYSVGLITSGIHRVANFNFKYNQARKSLVYSLFFYMLLVGIGEVLRLFTAVESETGRWSILITLRLLCGIILGEASTMALLLITSTGKYGNIILSLLLPSICLGQGFTLGLLFSKFLIVHSYIPWVLNLAIIGFTFLTTISASLVRHDDEYVEPPTGNNIQITVADLRPWLSSTFQSTLTTKCVCRDFVWLLVAVTIFSKGKMHDIVTGQSILTQIHDQLKESYSEGNGLRVSISDENNNSDNQMGLIFALFGRPTCETLAALWVKVVKLRLNLVIVLIAFVTFYINFEYKVLKVIKDTTALLYIIAVTSLTPLLANLVNSVKSKNIAVQCQVCASIVVVLGLSWILGTSIFKSLIEGKTAFVLNGVYVIAGAIDYVN